MKIRIKKTNPSAIIPRRAKPGDSGLDLHAHLPGGAAWLPPAGRLTIPTGIAIELPEGYEAQVRPRSGLAARHGIVGVLGTIDNGYRGEIGIVLISHSSYGEVIQDGDRIAQLVVCPVAYPEVEEVSELSETERGVAGFGSTGLNG